MPSSGLDAPNGFWMNGPIDGAARTAERRYFLSLPRWPPPSLPGRRPMNDHRRRLGGDRVYDEGSPANRTRSGRIAVHENSTSPMSRIHRCSMSRQWSPGSEYLLHIPANVLTDQHVFSVRIQKLIKI